MRGVALVFLLNGFVLSGCNSSVVNIHGKDRQVFFPEGEIEMNVGKESDKRTKGKYVTLSAGYVRSEGQFTQDLSDTESVNVNGAYIDGPGGLSATDGSTAKKGTILYLSALISKWNFPVRPQVWYCGSSARRDH